MNRRTVIRDLVLTICALVAIAIMLALAPGPW